MSLEPAKVDVKRLPDGGAEVKLPNGAVRVYDQDELADHVVALVHQMNTEPEAVDERWLAIVQAAVGQEAWDQAVKVIDSVIR